MEREINTCDSEELNNKDSNESSNLAAKLKNAASLREGGKQRI